MALDSHWRWYTFRSWRAKPSKSTPNPPPHNSWSVAPLWTTISWRTWTRHRLRYWSLDTRHRLRYWALDTCHRPRYWALIPEYVIDQDTGPLNTSQIEIVIPVRTRHELWTINRPRIRHVMIKILATPWCISVLVVWHLFLNPYILSTLISKDFLCRRENSS